MTDRAERTETMYKKQSRVYFIGAGPGDPELVTVKGQRLIKEADLVLYTGSLVPRAVVSCAGTDARIVDSSSMTLKQIHAMILETVRSGGMVARVHTGDPSLYGALGEQIALLDREKIPYEVVPGVTAAFAAAASAKLSFTQPEKVQTLILTRMDGRTQVPSRERLRELSRHKAALAIYLSAADPEKMADALLAGGYPRETPVVIGHKVGWPDEQVMMTRISGLSKAVRRTGIYRQAVFLVLPGQEGDPVFSRLYDPEFSHGFRSAG